MGRDGTVSKMRMGRFNVRSLMYICNLLISSFFIPSRGDSQTPGAVPSHGSGSHQEPRDERQALFVDMWKVNETNFSAWNPGFIPVSKTSLIIHLHQIHLIFSKERRDNRDWAGLQST